MEKIVDGARAFKAQKYPEMKELFEKLGSGQEPEVLFITCSDSRIDPHLITDTLPGDLFVIRNAGNLVPAYDGEAGGESATLEYAVSALKVKHIVVCGHSGCGAMGALMAGPEATKELPLVGEWLKLAEPTRIAVERMEEELTPEQATCLAIEKNVLHQLENLKTHPSVRQALAENRLELHGWVYDIPGGQILTYHESGFKALEEVAVV